MVDWTTAETVEDFVEVSRSTFKGLQPESDAWAKPSLFNVMSTVFGGLAFSSMNEARSGARRYSIKYATGSNLDDLAAQPPFNITRRSSTQATGLVRVNFPALSVIPIGYEFTNSQGIVYTATEEVTLTAGEGDIPVISTGYGSDQNSIVNRILESDDGQSQSLGIYGGYDVECDDQLKRRLFAVQIKTRFTGSACDYVDVITSLDGVSRAWAVEDGGRACIKFLMEDKYACGVPLQEDIDEIIAYFEDQCLANMFFCPCFEGAKQITITPEIEWETQPENICDVVEALNNWLRDNYDLGDGVRIHDIECFLSGLYPDLKPHIPCCEDYPPVPCSVYNCVELIGCTS